MRRNEMEEGKMGEKMENKEIEEWRGKWKRKED
jgi:hypothetical protein